MLSDYATNILAWYKQATAADLREGLEWYNRAERHAAALAAGTEFTVRETAAVIAALSPRVSWPGNADGARLMVTAATGARRNPPTVAGFPANRDKAWRILHHEDPADVLGGPKVTSFFANITGDLDAVTVDVWAARAAGMEDALTPKRYEQIADAFREVAKLLDIAPRDVQACVWVCIRRVTLEQSPTLAWILDRKEW